MLSVGVDTMELNKNSQKKLERILTVAEQQFNQQGYNKTTMNSIIMISQISRGTVYKYFNDKQMLYEQLIKNICDQELQQIQEIISTDSSFVQKIQSFINVGIQKNKKTHHNFYHDNFIKSNDLEIYMKKRNELYKNLKYLLYSQGKRDGYIKQSITYQTLELYFQIAKEGLIRKYSEISIIDKSELPVLLELVFASVLNKK